MEHERAEISKAVLNGQQCHWDTTFEQNPGMFGDAPSEPACAAAELFRKEGATRILELGGGQGRDTLFFARNGFLVTVLDYAESGICAITGTARAAGLEPLVTAVCRDVRDPFPFDDASFDACYSHMLLCMALTTSELEGVFREIRRVLRPGGLCVYTVRHTGDAHYGTGIPRGEEMCEVGGFIVHFFSREKVERLAEGFELVEIEPFEEGALPRKLFRVTLRKPQ